MKDDIEVELRGPLSKKQYRACETIFKSRGKFKEARERILIDYSFFLPKQGIRERTKDIRLRVTNGRPEIIIKLGKWGGREQRRELSVFVSHGEFDELVQIFAALGFTKGVLAVRKSKVYLYKGIEFALVEVSGHSFYFEAEKLVSNEDKKEEIRKKIKEICQELGLEVFHKKDFFDYIEQLNKEVNEVFDFNNYKDGYFKKRFKL